MCLNLILAVILPMQGKGENNMPQGKGTYGDQIDILASSLPLTISGLLIDQIIFATDDTGTNEVVEVISFH